MTKISIITPCYNSALYLTPLFTCLEQQTCKDFEVIFIDDNSSDNTLATLNAWKDKGIVPVTVLHSEVQLGPGAARNKGIDAANGEYIFCVDSDDAIETDAIAQVVDVIDTYHPDGILYDFTIVNHVTDSPRTIAEGLPQGMVSTSQALVATGGGTCGKIFKRSVLNEHNVRFPDLKRAEDIVFSRLGIGACEELYYIKKPLYLYLMRENSLTHNDSLYTHTNAMRAFDMIEERLKDKYPREMEVIFAVELLYSTTMTLVDKGVDKQHIKKHIQELVARYPHYRSNPALKKLPKHQRVALWAIQHQQIWILKLLLALRRKLSS